ncbi:1-(5-phosphoribosyl)-5-((5-phosphoribosylamino)methylideneamino)imidazole-4-carboxamide isomerase [Candidatus Micrarchaeota archaeon]|nr:1-(5-phosphoribosyl)-5-((5-phosphoribosylamino)methylideneamino)imidazole-4-carboxamide isomerase [Candidatus Micrarchaeota archaeon]
MVIDKFQVIPAIDLMGGQCVRLVKGEKQNKIEYAISPYEMAKSYLEYGAKLIHIVDLDGAFTGQMTNLPIISKLASEYPIQVGGGIRNEERIRELLLLGVKRVVVSSLLLKNQELATELKTKYKGKLVGSFDFKNGRLAYAGWTKESELKFNEVVAGLDEIVVTDTNKDGTFEGPNLELLSSLRASYPNIKIISAGGVKDESDLAALEGIGIDGVIIGRGFFEKMIKLSVLGGCKR